MFNAIFKKPSGTDKEIDQIVSRNMPTHYSWCAVDGLYFTPDEVVNYDTMSSTIVSYGNDCASTPTLLQLSKDS